MRNQTLTRDEVANDSHTKPDSVLGRLNEILATCIVFSLRYRRQETIAKQVGASSLSFEFQKLAQDEQDHVDLVAARIVELGGEPDFAPVGHLMADHSGYVERESLSDMIKDDWVAVRVAIDSCVELIRAMKGVDLAAVQILESLLRSKNAHARIFLNMIGTTPERLILEPRGQS